MSSEQTPVLCRVIPAFDSVITAWRQMRNDPSKAHLRPALDVGIEKMTSQYDDCRYGKAFIFAIDIYL